MVTSAAPGVLPDEVSRDARAGAWLIKIDLADGTSVPEYLKALDDKRRAFISGNPICGTATVSVGASLFDKAGLTDQRPRDLTAPPSLPQGEVEVHDILIYAFATADSRAAEFIRQIQTIPNGTVTFDRGYQRDDGRETFSQPDGLRNIPSRQRHRAAFVDIDSAPDEPDWTHGGAYLAHLKIQQNLPAWNALSDADKEQVVGRRADGTRLDRPAGPTDPPNWNDEPPFADPNTPPKNSHVRKTGPRDGDKDSVRFFRRGVPYIETSDTGSGTAVHEGLHFISYQPDLEVFTTILNRWMFNPTFPDASAGVDALVDPSRNLTTILRGSFYFALPDDDDFLGSGIFRPQGSRRVLIRLAIHNADDTPNPSGNPEGATFEIRDASGNVLATLTTNGAGRALSEPLAGEQDITIVQTGSAPTTDVATPNTQTVHLGCRSIVTDWINKVRPEVPPNQYAQ